MCFHLHNSLTFSNHLELGASVRQVEQGFECANFESSPSSCWPRCGKFETRTQLNSNETCNDSVMQRPGNSRKPCEVRSATPVPLLRIKGTLVRSITWLPITVELQVESVEVFFWFLCDTPWALSTFVLRQAVLWRHWIRLAGQARSSHDIVISLAALCLDIGSWDDTGKKVEVSWKKKPKITGNII
jgi:hypothetical protein